MQTKQTNFIGMKEEEVQYQPCRVMHRDGEDFFGTCDFNPARLNLKIILGSVTEFWFG
jgi:hypothetical protein